MPAANATRRRGSLHNWHCDGRGDLFADELPPTPAGSTFVVITALRHETDPGQLAGIAICVPDRDFTRWLFHQDVWRFLEGYDGAEGEVGPQPKPPPPTLRPENDRDEPCAEALDPALDALAQAAERAGWLPAEVVAVVLGWAVHRAAEGAGLEAARELLDDAAEMLALSGG